jgi:hypothetical protein
VGRFVLWGLALYGGFEIVRQVAGALGEKGGDQPAGQSGIGWTGASSPLSTPRGWFSAERDNKNGNWAMTPKIRPPASPVSFRSDGVRYV